MKTAVVYYSRGGGTKKMADAFTEFPVLNTQTRPDVSSFDFLVVLCPGSGDRELPLPMEDFIIGIKDTPKKYTFCEMGDSAGYHYEGPGMGPGVILRLVLKNWTLAVEPFELETTPKVSEANWLRFLAWKDKVVGYVRSTNG